MSKQSKLSASMIQPLRRSILALVALVLATAASAQTISTQAISEPDSVGFAYRFFSPDGQWVCVGGNSLLCAPSNASTLASVHHPPEHTGVLQRQARFIPETNRILYMFRGVGNTPLSLINRLWVVDAGQPQSAVDVTPQWPAANIEAWIVSDEGDIVLFVEDGGDRAIYATRVDTPASFVEIGSNITIGSLVGPNAAQFAVGNQAVYARLDDRIWRIPLDAGPAIAMSQLGATVGVGWDERGGYLYFRAKLTGTRLDLFRVPVTGGVAQSLNLDTTHGITTRPFFSPDGTFACFFEQRVIWEFDLACSDLRGASPQTVGFGTVASEEYELPVGRHFIASDNRTLFGNCDLCSGTSGESRLYRASVDGSSPVTLLTGSSVRIDLVTNLPTLNRVLFRVFTNSSTKSWQSTTYDFTQAVDYPFDGGFYGYDAGSDRLAFGTDINPFSGVEFQLISVRSDGSDDTFLTGGGFSNGIGGAVATADGTAVIAYERYQAFPSLSEGARLVRARIDGTDTRVLGSFPRTGTSTPLINGTTLSPTDPYGAAFVLTDEGLRTEVISYSGTPAPLFRDRFESAP